MKIMSKSPSPDLVGLKEKLKLKKKFTYSSAFIIFFNIPIY